MKLDVKMDFSHFKSATNLRFNYALTRGVSTIAKPIYQVLAAYTPVDTGDLKDSLSYVQLDEYTLEFRYHMPYAFWVYIKPNSKNSDHWIDKALANHMDEITNYLKSLVLQYY